MEENDSEDTVNENNKNEKIEEGELDENFIEKRNKIKLDYKKEIFFHTLLC